MTDRYYVKTVEDFLPNGKPSGVKLHYIWDRENKDDSFARKLSAFYYHEKELAERIAHALNLQAEYELLEEEESKALVDTNGVHQLTWAIQGRSLINLNGRNVYLMGVTSPETVMSCWGYDGYYVLSLYQIGAFARQIIDMGYEEFDTQLSMGFLDEDYEEWFGEERVW